MHTTTKNKTLAVIKRILFHGRKYHGIKEDYSIFLDNFPKTRDERIKEKERFEYIWNDDDFSKFLSYVKDDKNKLMFTLFFKHGLRLGEGLSLKWKNINFKNHFLNIDENITRKTESKEIEVKDTKNESSTRNIYIGKKNSEMMKKLYKKEKQYYGFTKEWFISGDKEPMNPRVFDTTRVNAMKEAGFEETVTHDLRHMFVTNSWSKVPLTALSAYIGHKNVSVTLETYSHLSQADAVAMIDFIDNNV